MTAPSARNGPKGRGVRRKWRTSAAGPSDATTRRARARPRGPSRMATPPRLPVIDAMSRTAGDALPADERTDHGEQLDVAEAEPLDAGGALVCRGDGRGAGRRRGTRPRTRSRSRRRPGTSAETARPIRMPGRLTTSGMMPSSRSMNETTSIAHEKANATTAHGVIPKRATESTARRARHRLDHRIARGDGRATRATAATEPEPGEERDVVVPRDRRRAGRASRAGPHDGLPGGDAVDADVEKAPDREPDEEARREAIAGRAASEAASACAVRVTASGCLPGRQPGLRSSGAGADQVGVSGRRVASCRCTGSSARRDAWR